MNEPQEPDAPAKNRPTAIRIPVRSISLAIIATVVFYIGLGALTEGVPFYTAASVLPGTLFVQVMALSALSYLLRFARWHHFILTTGHKAPTLRNLEIYLAAFALTLTPGKAGETIRSIYIHRYGVSYSQSIGVFISERILDLIAVGVLALMVVSEFPEQRPWMFLTIASILIVILLIRTRLITLIGARAERYSIVGHAALLVSTIRFLLTGRRLAVAVPLSLMAWIAQSVSLYLIIDALGYELAASSVMAIYCLSLLAGAVSFIPGGLGATEATIVLLLSAAGIGSADAITASLVSRGLTLWFAVGIGIVAMSKTALVK